MADHFMFYFQLPSIISDIIILSITLVQSQNLCCVLSNKKGRLRPGVAGAVLQTPLID